MNFVLSMFKWFDPTRRRRSAPMSISGFNSILIKLYAVVIIRALSLSLLPK